MKNLKKIIICPECESPNLKKELKPDEAAFCSTCGKILYKKEKSIELKIFSLVISGILFFLIAMFFPIVDINIIGYKENLKIVEASLFLFNQGYIFISLFVFITVFLFPAICAFLYFLSALFLLFRHNLPVLKKILILITALKDWCFLDIFFIAILVSLIKIFSYASVTFNVGFIAYILFLSIMFYLVKIMGVKTLWDLYEENI